MNTDKPILKELNHRKSVRAFLPEEIEEEKLDALWEAARWAPSSSNKQEWHYYAITGELRQKLSEALTRGNQWALAAPLLIAVTRDTSIENATETRAYGMYDVALSVMSLVIEAEHQGLRAHQMGGFKEEILRDLLKIPAHEAPVVMLAIGYEGNVEDVDPIIQEKEKRPRTRKPLEEMVTVVKEIPG